MTPDWLSDVIAAFDADRMTDMTLITLVSWWFLLRVQSETTGLMIGNVMMADKMPKDTLSGIWYDDNTITLRLAKGKHRPKGSLLRRKCACSRTHTGSNLCFLYRYEAYVQDKNICEGECLFMVKPAKYLAVLKAILLAACMPNVSLLGLQSFRAGHATYVATTGCKLIDIMKLGEWNSKAALAYVNEDSVDIATFTRSTLEASSDEDSDAIITASVGGASVGGQFLLCRSVLHLEACKYFDLMYLIIPIVAPWLSSQ